MVIACHTVASLQRNAKYQPVYGGMPTPVYVPRFLGADKILTFETQLPDGQDHTEQFTPTTTGGSKASQTGSTESFALEISAKGSGSAEGAASSPIEKQGKKSTVGPVIGGVLGGVAFITAVGAAIWYFNHGKKQPPGNTHATSHDNEGELSANIREYDTVPVVYPQELSGRPKQSAYEIG